MKPFYLMREPSAPFVCNVFTIFHVRLIVTPCLEISHKPLRRDARNQIFSWKFLLPRIWIEKTYRGRFTSILASCLAKIIQIERSHNYHYRAVRIRIILILSSSPHPSSDYDRNFLMRKARSLSTSHCRLPPLLINRFPALRDRRIRSSLTLFNSEVKQWMWPTLLFRMKDPRFFHLCRLSILEASLLSGPEYFANSIPFPIWSALPLAGIREPIINPGTSKIFVFMFEAQNETLPQRAWSTIGIARKSIWWIFSTKNWNKAHLWYQGNVRKTP